MAKLKPKPHALARKVGPLPVWAWAALALAGWFFFLRSPGAAASSSSLPAVSAAPSSGSQLPVSGQGTPADNLSGDLLDALVANQKSSYDALLAALQYGSAGGGGSFGGVPSGFGGGASSGGGADTAAVTAETIDSGTNNAPVDSFAAPIITTDPGLAAVTAVVNEQPQTAAVTTQTGLDAVHAAVLPAAVVPDTTPRPVRGAVVAA